MAVFITATCFLTILHGKFHNVRPIQILGGSVRLQLMQCLQAHNIYWLHSRMHVIQLLDIGTNLSTGYDIHTHDSYAIGCNCIFSALI